MEPSEKVRWFQGKDKIIKPAFSKGSCRAETNMRVSNTYVLWRKGFVATINQTSEAKQSSANTRQLCRQYFRRTDFKLTLLTQQHCPKQLQQQLQGRLSQIRNLFVSLDTPQTDELMLHGRAFSLVAMFIKLPVTSRLDFLCISYTYSFQHLLINRSSKSVQWRGLCFYYLVVHQLKLI